MAAPTARSWLPWEVWEMTKLWWTRAENTGSQLHSMSLVCHSLTDGSATFWAGPAQERGRTGTNFHFTPKLSPVITPRTFGVCGLVWFPQNIYTTEKKSFLTRNFLPSQLPQPNNHKINALLLHKHTQRIPPGAMNVSGCPQVSHFSCWTCCTFREHWQILTHR